MPLKLPLPGHLTKRCGYSQGDPGRNCRYSPKEHSVANINDMCLQSRERLTCRIVSVAKVLCRFMFAYLDIRSFCQHDLRASDR